MADLAASRSPAQDTTDAVVAREGEIPNDPPDDAGRGMTRPA
jgi:hypothetical protein